MSEHKKKQPDKPYPVHTGQETKAMLRALSDGKSGRDWKTIVGAEIRVHQTDGEKHRVQIALSDKDKEQGKTLEHLEAVTLHRDADEDYMLLYITKQLVPEAPLSPNTRAAADIDLDDVIKAVGWYPQTALDRANMRRRVWEFIKFVARAEIVGARTGKYYDRATGQEIETTIHSAPWTIELTEQAADEEPTLLDDDVVPVRVTIVATKMWTELTARPDMAQFLPLGEVLGAIPGAKPSGAWARVIGLALCDVWRRHPRGTKKQPTRSKLLEFCTPATGPVSDVLTGPNPRRAIEYWAGALEILVKCDFLERSGEAVLSYEEMRATLGARQDWKEDWLEGEVVLKPGPAMLTTVNELAAKQHKAKSRNLKSPKRQRSKQSQESD